MHSSEIIMKKSIGLACVLAMTSFAAKATHVWEDAGGWWDSHWVAVQGPKFTAQELSFDLFGSFIAEETDVDKVFETNIHGGKWGGGLGLNYFFLRELGISGDLNAADNGGEFIDLADGSLVARLPIESIGLAPYIFGGGGRAFDPAWEWFGQAGVGLDLRFTPMTGIFVDGRYMWMDQTPDRLLLRGGLRLVF